VRLAQPVHCAAKDGTVLMETVHGGLELFQCNTLLRPGCLAAACVSSSSSGRDAAVSSSNAVVELANFRSSEVDTAAASHADDAAQDAPECAAGVVVDAAAAPANAAETAAEEAADDIKDAAGSSSSSSRVWLFCPDPLCLLSKPSTTQHLALPEW
jgi:hypothetical protein